MTPPRMRPGVPAPPSRVAPEHGTASKQADLTAGRTFRERPPKTFTMSTVAGPARRPQRLYFTLGRPCESHQEPHLSQSGGSSGATPARTISP